MRPIAAVLFLIAMACVARLPPPEPAPVVRPRFCSDTCLNNLECRTRGNNCPFCTFGHCGLLPPSRPAPLDAR